MTTREQIAELQGLARATAVEARIAELQRIARGTAEKALIARLQRLARENERPEDALTAA